MEDRCLPLPVIVCIFLSNSPLLQRPGRNYDHPFGVFLFALTDVFRHRGYIVVEPLCVRFAHPVKLFNNWIVFHD